MAASGAWRRTRSSQLCFVSSIAAHSSPRGSTPASANASGGTCVSTLPNVSSPRALARRRAGSTVSTSTLPPWWTAAIAAAAAAVVVLPTPPEPQWITISLAASSCSIEPVDAVACGAAIRTRAPRRGARRPGGWRGRRGCAGRGTARRAAACPRGSSSRRRVRWAARVRRRVTASWAPSRIGRTDVPSASLSRASFSSSDEPLEHLLLAAAEQLGQHAVHDDGGEVDDRLVAQSFGELERLVDRHLLRRRHDHHAGLLGVAEDVDHPARLVAHHAHLHELLDRLRRRELTGDVAGGHRVDDDEVVAALAHLPQELPDREDLLHAGRGVGHEVEGAGQRAEASHQRDLELEAQVLLERLLGVHRHGEEAGRHLALLERRGTDLEEVGQVALGVDLADEGALAVLRSEERERRRDGGLADASLAGDEEELAVEQVDGHRRGSVSSRSRCGGRRRGCRSRRRRASRPRRPPGGPCGR